LLSYGAALRQRLRDDGVTVAVVTPDSLAIRSAARLHEPRLTVAGADRIASQIRSGLRRYHGVVAIPGPATLALRALRLLPSSVRKAVRVVRLGDVEAIREPADKGSLPGDPLPGESGPGD
jgi:short-subunit dehydrogenase